MDAPSAASIARLWARSPNAEKIRRVLRRFHALTQLEYALLLIGLDIEEGILPLIHPGGRASRREVLSDQRLIAVGDDVEYAHHVAVVLGTTAAPTTPAETATPRAQAEAAEASRPARARSVGRAVTLEEVVAEDKLGMAVWFPQFALGYVKDGRPAWCGSLQPLAFVPHVYQVLAVYQPDPRAPLIVFVLQPVIHPHAPHRFLDGALCTFFASSGCWIRGREGDDLTELLRFAVVWLIRYECWLMFQGWWPGVEVPHNAEWLLANVRDDDFCPYHMPRLWGDCCKAPHLAEVERERGLNVGILPPRRESH